MAVTTTELIRGWQCKQTEDDSEAAWLTVRKVPSVIHLDLREAGKIPDPFIDMNELAVRWVADKSWTYKTTFPTPTSVADGARTDLVFKGLDTFAKATLNGSKILEADNMFLEYRIDITNNLQRPSTTDAAADQNVLEIVFDSALLRGRELVKQHEHEHDFIAHQTESSRLPVRKAQCHWGWDWGPILITVGPWKPVLLETYVVRIEDIWWQGEVSEDLKTVEGKFFATVDGARKESLNGAKIKFELLLDGKGVFQSQAEIDEGCIATADFRVEDPSLWYPHGYGEHHLYELKTTFSLAGDSRQPASTSKSIGFRRCELIQEPDEYGKSFYFRINNIDIFAGGSCWIPADSFIPRIGEDGYRKWMELMIEGNQIMTRVWGGGIYEDPAFYSACDELGILVFQDFAFACASYPTYPSFLSQISTEARQNIRRLRSHPSLTIWAGNNEDYQIQQSRNLEYDYDGDKDPERWLKTTFPARYIYEFLLPKIVQEESPGAVYHPSSPWGDGKKTWDPTVGDIHQWNVWHASMRRYQELSLSDMSGRFVSEFGMEAYPHLSTIRNHIATQPAQQYPGSMTLDYHNRALDHERRLMTYVAENFRIKYDLASFTHITQVMQSDAITFAYRSWRREWGSPGRRKCGGVLVWQMNDTWPTMSWAVADYFRVKKPGFYAIKRALKPVVVGLKRPFYEWTSGHCDPTVAARDNRYDLWVSNLTTQDVHVDIVLRVVSIGTGKDLFDAIKKENVPIQANATTEIVKDEELFHDVTLDATRPLNPAQDWDPYIIHASLLLDGEVIATDIVWPHPIKYLDFPNRDVSVTLSSAKDSLTITAARPVHGFVFQETKDWVTFSDNGFDVVPGEEVVVRISDGKVREEDLQWTWIGADRGEIGFGD